MAPRQARKSEPAAHQSESEDENSQQSSQEADMHVLKAARNVVSTVWAFSRASTLELTDLWD